MDTVTETAMCIAMAQLGGMGFLHYNATVEEQTAWVAAVKNHQDGTVASAVCLPPDAKVRYVGRVRVRVIPRAHSN